MSLRTKLIALFASLAVVPLLAIGAIEYVRSTAAIAELITSQTDVITGRLAGQIADRYSPVAADLRLLAENVSAQSLLRAAAVQASADPADTAYLNRVYHVAQRHMPWIAFRDTAGRAVLTLQGDHADSAASDARLYIASLPIRSDSGVLLGRVDAAVFLDSVVHRADLDARVGSDGRTALADTLGTPVVAGAGLSDLPPPSAFRSRYLVDSGSTWHFQASTRDTGFAGSISAAQGSPFVVMSLGRIGEFGDPFMRIRNGNILIVLATTITVAFLFFVLVWRATRSLAQITAAADAVGRGDLEPELPPANRDEIGRLSSAFALMARRVRHTLQEIEQGRRMAVVGEFASQISHEIRNPLTSIKLNLQVLERATATGEIPSGLVQPVAISLREVERLDRVVRGVLQLGRAGTATPSIFRLHDAAANVTQSLDAALQRHGVRVAIDDRGDGRPVRGEPALIESALMNLLLNAAEASAAPGDVQIEIVDSQRDGMPVSRVRVSDGGPGVAVMDRERIFSPFYTSKPSGAGLGLSIAHRTVEQHGGRLWVEDRPDGLPGASFVLELPAAAEHA